MNQGYMNIRSSEKIPYEEPKIAKLGQLSQLIQGESGEGTDMPPNDTPCWGTMCVQNTPPQS